MNKKKFFMLLAAVLLGIASAYAQSKWVIRFNDGSEKAFNINDIREMFPRENAPETNPKVRIAIYETVPSYSVRDVMFNSSTTDATSHAILFNDSQTIDFGPLNYTDAEHYERMGTKFLGRTSNKASFAGNAEDNYYTICLSNENEKDFTISVNFTLEATDGSGEIINITDAKAHIPAENTKWKSGYAYTYIFKITDVYSYMLTEGMIVITLDSVIIESTDSSTTR